MSQLLGEKVSDKVSISHQGCSHDFCLREGINVELLESLLKQVFSIDGPILALQSQKNGVIFDLFEFCSSKSSNQINGSFQLIVGTNHNWGNNMRQSQRSQSTHSSHFSRNQQAHKSSQKSLQRPKSVDITQRNSQRYSIKSGSKYSEDITHQNTFYVEDYEGFMMQQREDVSQLYCFLLFDENKTMRLYGQSICRAYQSQFPNVDFYYSLYPSKRSRGPFQPSDDAYLLSFFQGQSMIFEREVAVSSEVSDEIVKAINQFIQKQELSNSIQKARMLNFNEDGNYTENSFSVVNPLGSETGYTTKIKDNSFEEQIIDL